MIPDLEVPHHDYAGELYQFALCDCARICEMDHFEYACDEIGHGQAEEYCLKEMVDDGEGASRHELRDLFVDVCY